MKTAVELGRAIAAEELDPVELAEQTLTNVENHPHHNDIFVTVTRDRAMAEAEAARKRQKSGDLCSPLDGVPISWKDLFDTKDILTEGGSKLLKGRVPEADCELVKRATDAGLVCIGKTHTSELAFSGLGINPNAATPPNINGEGLIPGGSSSGAAASVAHGFVPIGMGSDTGGSVRIPSAWNNLVGLKTTSQWLPLDGVLQLCPGFDTAGPLCTSVEDAWTIAAILANEPAVLPAAKPIEECRFLVNRTIVMDGLDEAVEKSFHASIDALRTAGATIEFADLASFQEILPLGPTLFPYEAWQQWGEEISANPGTVFKPVENRFRSGEHITEDEYKSAWKKMEDLRRTYAEETAGYDAVLAPTICIKPPTLEAMMADVEQFQKTNLLALRNTRFGNMFGLCALTLPTREPASGLMVSVEPFGEKKLTSLGLGIEKILKAG